MSLFIPEEVEACFEEAVAIYRKLHQEPEILYDLPKTSSFVAQYLKDLGLNVKEKIGISGVVAELNSPGPCILLRADMDALTITEEADVEFRSQIPGRMHACGHDGHVTMLLLAAKILSKAEGLKGSVKFVFQPAEEGGAGALKMRDDGVLEGVDEVYAVHLGAPLKLGDYIYPYDYASTNSDRYEITVTGKGGHGSSPDTCIDPVPASAQLILSINSIAANTEYPFRVIASIVKTSETYNAIPSIVKISGCTRSFREEDRQHIKEKMRQSCEGFSKVFNIKADLFYEDVYNSTKNHDQCSKFALEAMKKTSSGQHFTHRLMIGEDFSYFADVRPGAYIIIGCNGEPGAASMHSSRFKIDEKSLLIGITYWVNLVKLRLS